MLLKYGRQEKGLKHVVPEAQNGQNRLLALVLIQKREAPKTNDERLGEIFREAERKSGRILVNYLRSPCVSLLLPPKYLLRKVKRGFS